MRALLVVLVAAALASAGAVVSAGPCPAKAQAKRAFDAGHLAYRRGTYEEAILKFQDSYALCEMPLTLLAIANAYERLGDLEAALEHLEKYRPHAAKGEQAEIDTRIATLTGRIDEQQQEAKRKEEEERKAAKAREEEEARRKAEQSRATEESADRPLWWAGWIAGGVGVAALGGSVVTGALALSVDGDLSDACVEGRCPPDRGEDIERLAALSTATDVLLVIGATLTASGIAMLLLDSASDSAPSVEMALGPGSASLRGSF